MITPEHWNNFKAFLQAKANERKITDTAVMVEMIFEFWETLSDENKVKEALEDMELAQLTLSIPLNEEAIKKAKTRKEELEKRRQPTPPGRRGGNT